MENKLVVYKLIELLGKQDPSPEEKRQKALLRAALLGEYPVKFINELSLGKVNCDTLEGIVEFAKAHNEAQIRSYDLSEAEKDNMVEKENIRLNGFSEWIKSFLKQMGVLQ